jgi:DNA-binding NarL/FixJ family response regulator
MKTSKLVKLVNSFHDSVEPDKAPQIQNLIHQVTTSTDLYLVMQNHHPIKHAIVLKKLNVEQDNYYADYLNNSKKQIHLSPREQAIAQLVAEGLPNKVIAHQLQISQWTVASHLRRLFIKVGVSSRTAMIAKLLSQDLLCGRSH